MPTKTRMRRTRHNGEPSYRGEITRLLMEAGGEMMHDALKQALMDTGIRMTAPNGKDRFRPNLWQMKNEGLLKYKPSKENYAIRLSTKAIMDLPPPNGDRAPPAAPMSLPVAVTQPAPRGRPPKQEEHVAPVYGVALHLVGNQVSLYVNNNRHKFTREEFGEVSDLFSVLNKRG